MKVYILASSERNAQEKYFIRHEYYISYDSAVEAMNDFYRHYKNLKIYEFDPMPASSLNVLYDRDIHRSKQKGRVTNARSME